MSTLCYVCMKSGDRIDEGKYRVYLEDDDHRTVYVGPTCFKKVERAGDDGILAGKGFGPRVFSTYEQAAAYTKGKS